MQEWPEGFDLAALLAPITPEAPAGIDLRENRLPDSLYYRLRDERREASAAERAEAAPSEDEPRPVGGATSLAAFLRWRTVRELAVEALTSHSKDLEIGAWFTEALVRSDGLIGLAAGTRLLAGLAEGFWDELFPQPDEEGIASRLAPVAGLNGVGRDGTLLEPLRKIVLFERPRDNSPFQFWQYLQSEEVAKSGDAERRQSFYDTGRVVPLEAIESEAAHVGTAHFAQLRDRIAEAEGAWEGLGEILAERAGAADAPPTSQVHNLLQDIGRIAKRFTAPDSEAPEAAATPPPVETAGAELSTPASLSRADGLATREDALRALAQIADFFRRTEPLSPITYTLQEAVRRSRLTWPELLEEIVPDATSRSAILSSLGIRPPQSE